MLPVSIYLSVTRFERLFDFLALLAGALTDYLHHGLAIGTDAFHGFVQRLRISFSIEPFVVVDRWIRLSTIAD